MLRDRMGERWEGDESEGRDEMVKILQAEPGYDRTTAIDTITAMIKSGRLRYHSPVKPVVPVVSPGGVPAPLTGAPAPIAPVFALGHWQIGDEAGDESAGRAGQVTPH